MDGEGTLAQLDSESSELFEAIAGREPESVRSGYLVIPRSDLTYAQGTTVPLLGVMRMVQRPSGLVVPTKGTGAQMAEMSTAFMTAATFTGVSAPRSVAQTLASSHDTESFLAECATVMALLRDPTISNRGAQLALAESRLSPKALETAKNLLQDDWAFLSAQSVLGVMKLALSEAPLTPREPKQLRADVTMAALVLADNLDRLEIDDTSPLWQGVVDPSLAVYLIQNQIFNHSVELGVILGRWRRTRELARQILPDLADTFDTLFQMATGTTPEILFNVGFGLLLHLQSHKEVLIPHNLLDQIKAPTAQVQAAVDLLAADLPTLKAEVVGEIDSVGFEWASNSFKRFPVLTTRDGSLLVLDPTFLCERICGSAFFWEVFNFVKGGNTDGSGRTASQLRGELGRFTGLVAEEYAVDRLSHIFDTSFGSVPRLLREADLQALWPGESCCDVLIDGEHTWLALDVVSHRVSASASQSGSVAALEEDLRQIVDEKAAQLDATIRRLISNGGALPGQEPRSHASRYHPVVIAASGFPWNPFTSIAVQSRLRNLGLLTSPEVVSLGGSTN